MMLECRCRRQLSFACLLVVLIVTPSKTVLGVRNLQIVSPLQALTIWDPESKEEADETGGRTFRSRFLPRFKTGLHAETVARKQLEENDIPLPPLDANSKDWASKAAIADRQRSLVKEKYVEQAYDTAVSNYDNKMNSKKMQISGKKKNPNKYQFVGVINTDIADPPITWYVRKKPTNAKWSLRLIHVNRQAIIKDLYNRGKIDIFARYENTGEINEKTKQPIIKSKYIVRERSWKNLWNFSPKHLFTDSSGMYWRERRLRPGLYTDGNTVYEASYRYRDGRNGMHRISSFKDYLNSKSIKDTQKNKILKRLKNDTPDVVLET